MNAPIKTDLLTIEQAKEALQSIGLNCTERQVARWAHERVLPFFRFGKRLVISKNELHMHFFKLQSEALRETAKRSRRR